MLAVSLVGSDASGAAANGVGKALSGVPAFHGLASQLQQGAIWLTELEKHHPHDLPWLYAALQGLWGERRIAISDRPVDPLLGVTPTVMGQTLDLSFKADTRWKLSRFAFLRRSESGGLRIETPLHPFVATIHRSVVGALFVALGSESSVEDLAKSTGLATDEIEPLLRILRLAGMIEPVQMDGATPEEVSDTLRQWEFHDALFHTRSRMGRHSELMGAQFRFRGEIEAQPVVKPNPWLARSIPLHRPDLNKVAASDLPFTVVLESRHSGRDQLASRPITLPQLGEFLYRTARIRRRYDTQIGEFSSRPYPSGGAAYELELYVTVDACAGLRRGFYYYDPEQHALCAVSAPDDEMENLITDAWTSAAQLCRPQILITIASRFQRVSWKYSSIAYATQLKNVGVLYQTFYLVATAMGLAGCALGLGNSERSRRLSGTDFFEESSIGEFMLGSSGKS